MQALKARVVNGRYVIDEPALTEQDRAALYASLDRALDDEDAGRFVHTSEFLAADT